MKVAPESQTNSRANRNARYFDFAFFGFSKELEKSVRIVSYRLNSESVLSIEKPERYKKVRTANDFGNATGGVT